MSFIKTMEEFRRGVPVNVTSTIEQLLPALAAGALEYIEPVLGPAQYQDLLAGYEASTLSPLQTQLLGHVQVGLANLAYGPFLAVAQLSIDEQGIRIKSDEYNKQAFQWQLDDLRDYLRETGQKALEAALRLLDEHKADFPLWAQSAAYTYNKALLLNNATDFQRYYNINGSRRTFLALLPILAREEVFSLEPQLSPEFCAALRAEIQTGTTSADTQHVLRLLHPALVNFTVAEALGELSVDLSSGGLVVKELAVGGSNNRTQRQAPADVLERKTAQALEAGRNYLRALLAFLNANASATRYPAFFKSANYCPPATAPTGAGPVSGRRRIYNAC